MTSTCPTHRRKAFAYITHGNRLLLFSHPDAPAAGIQVPAGTIEEGEAPDRAVMREAFEETGLPDLELARFLGEQIRTMADCGIDEVHHRFFFHLKCTSDPPATWHRYEMAPADVGAEPPLFEFFWVHLPDGVPELFADHGYFLQALADTPIA
jgi:8-oxo-dGTP diphosphatase